MSRQREGLKIVAMVIARMGSTRVPGKSLMQLAGKPVVEHAIDIARKIPGVDEVALVTTDLGKDDPLAELGARVGVPVVRGHPEFVLDRIVQAIEERQADIIVYVGGDCPLLDPIMLGDAIDRFFESGCDYLNNYDPPTFPEGLDVNVITREAVLLAHANALAPSQRIHAFSYLSLHPGSCRIDNYTHQPDLSRHHWSLDFPEDFDFLKLVYARLYKPSGVIQMANVLSLIENDPEVAMASARLERPSVAHAFWNSPGIIRDMNADIIELCRLGHEAFARGDREMTHRCYREVGLIAGALEQYAST